jgi:hypothetical protein
MRRRAARYLQAKREAFHGFSFSKLLFEVVLRLLHPMTVFKSLEPGLPFLRKTPCTRREKML